MSDDKIIPFTRPAPTTEDSPEREVACDVCGRRFMTTSSPFFSYRCSEECALHRHDGGAA